MFGEKNPDKNPISFFQIKAEKYLTPQERERAEMLAKLEMERRLIALVLSCILFTEQAIVADWAI